MKPIQATESVFFRRAKGLKDRAGIRKFYMDVRRQVAGGSDFHCLLTDDAELERLNRQFLGKDYPTDVLSFPSGNASGGFLGELAISVDRAGAQALEHGHTLEQEVRILMLHGLLHLMGMDHETDRGRMRRVESQWRVRLALPEALIERASK